MPRRFALVMTLTAWLFATGSHWDLVQTVAWARMFVTYSQSMPVLEAAEKTFVSGARCWVCKVVTQAKQQEQSSDSAVPGTKFPKDIQLATVSSARLFLSPTKLYAGLLPASVALQGAEPAAPLLTPPRALS